jgi:endonuclease G
MAKFKKNHGDSRRGTAFLFRAVILMVCLFFILGYGFFKLNSWMNSDVSVQTTPASSSEKSAGSEERLFLPSGGNGEIVHHKYYTLSYNESREQADWVAYHLTKSSLVKPNVRRARKFRPDYKINSRSAIHSDYTNSDYTRGHLVPAGDMAFNEEAMEESFIMSNMSPQMRTFNNGIWKELEETVRDWAYFYEDVYVVSGPLFSSSRPKTIGRNRVAVPDAFYKVILDDKTPYAKSIAFIIPHELSVLPLSNYAITVDELEAKLGINFFDALLEDSLESQIESRFDLEQWPFDENRFKQRINNWNRDN